MAALAPDGRLGPALQRPLEPLEGELVQLDGDVVALGVELGALILRGPGPLEVPAGDLVAGAVEDDDRAVVPLDRPVDVAPVPVVEGRIRGHAPAELEVAELGQPGQLPRGRVLAALAVLDH